MTTLLFDDFLVECDSSTSPLDSHKNEPGDFHFPLPLRYELGSDERYEVACLDITFPITWFNLEQDAKVTFSFDSSKTVLEANVYAGLYPDVSDLIEVINVAMDESIPTVLNSFRGLMKFTYQPTLNTVTLMRTGAAAVSGSILSLSPSLNILLGFFLGRPNRPCDISNNIHNFYLHLDLIEPQIYGDRTSQISQIIHIPSRLSYGKIEKVSFIPRKYMCLSLTEFNQIKISIKDAKNNIINFRHGTVKVWLHIRRCHFMNRRSISSI